MPTRREAGSDIGYHCSRTLTSSSGKYSAQPFLIRYSNQRLCLRETTSWKQPPVPLVLFSHPPLVSTMASPQETKGRDGVLSALDLLIQALSIAKDTCGIPPAQVALGSATVVLTMIRVQFLLLLEDGYLIRVYPRTRWPTIRISSNSDERAVMCAKYSTEN